MGVYRKYTRELLTEAVAASTSIAGVLRHLGLRQSGGAHTHISRTVKKMQIDTTHFRRFENGAAQARLTPDQILIRRPEGASRSKPHLLRRALVESGRRMVCAMCGNPARWMDQPLRLDVDHVDGDFTNNLADNLRFLCPNCHSQTPNFAGRSKDTYARTPTNR